MCEDVSSRHPIIKMVHQDTLSRRYAKTPYQDGMPGHLEPYQDTNYPPQYVPHVEALSARDVYSYTEEPMNKHIKMGWSEGRGVRYVNQEHIYNTLS